MSRHRFRTVVKGLITHDGAVLIGRKEEEDGHPISGEWHLLGGHVEFGEDLEAATKREIAEETGLDVEVEELVDAATFAWGDGATEDSLQLLYHCEAASGDAEVRDDLQAVRWVDPEDLPGHLHEGDAERLVTRPQQASFLEDLTTA